MASIDAKNYLKNEVPVMTDYSSSFESRDLYTDEQLMKAYDTGNADAKALIEKIIDAEIKCKFKWHYVSNNDLPKEDGSYQVAIKYQDNSTSVDICIYSKDNKDWTYPGVYAWTELPAVPEVK